MIIKDIGVGLGQVLYAAFILSIQFMFTHAGRAWPSWTRLVTVYMMGNIACHWLIARIRAIMPL